jgi:hypothetical protein
MSVIHSKIRYEEFPRERGSPIVSAGIYEEFAKKLADNDRPMFKGGYKLEENFVEKDQAWVAPGYFIKASSVVSVEKPAAEETSGQRLFEW